MIKRKSGKIVVKFRRPGGYKKLVLVEQLVADAFLGRKPSKKHRISHKDLDFGNNDYRNLEYITRLEQVLKGEKVSSRYNEFENCGNEFKQEVRKLALDFKYRSRNNKWVTSKAIADRFRITVFTLRQILKEREIQTKGRKKKS